jgi:hypothetical protein
MSHWNHRVLKQTLPDGTEWYSLIILYQILSLCRCNPYRAYCNALYPVRKCFRDCLSHNIVRAVAVRID